MQMTYFISDTSLKSECVGIACAQCQGPRTFFFFFLTANTKLSPKSEERAQGRGGKAKAFTSAPSTTAPRAQHITSLQDIITPSEE